MNTLDCPRTGIPLHDRPRGDIYGCPDPVPVGDSPSFDTSRADELFDAEIRSSPLFKNHSVGSKLREWQCLFISLACAHRANTCVRYPRANNAQATRARRNVVECALDRGLIREERSPAGAPKESRLVALPKIHSDFAFLTVPHQAGAAYVEMRRRKRHPKMQDEVADKIGVHTSRVIPFDRADATAVEFQTKLALINQVNSRVCVTYERYDSIGERWTGTHTCRPIHVAKFLDGFHLGGRLYGDGLSHQHLQKVERRTIRFDGWQSVELDFVGFGPRMLYHLSHLNYDADPYALWPRTSDAQRYLVKLMLNALLNAESERSAVQACDCEGRVTNWEGHYKIGNALRDAHRVQQARRGAGMSFPQICDAVKRHHAPIAQHFCSGVGLRLMRRDSRIALNVLHHFALKGIPCLGVHDSFIVPAYYTGELHAIMHHCYRDEMNGFSPVVNGGGQVVQAA